MSWTTTCPSPRLTFSTSTKPSSPPTLLNYHPNCIRSSTLPPSSALPDQKVSSCSEPVAFPTTKRTKRSRNVVPSLPSLSTETKWPPPQSSTKPTHPTKRRESEPHPPSFLLRTPQQAQCPLRNLPHRRLPRFPTSPIWCPNRSPVKTAPKNLLFRGRSGSPVISSSRAFPPLSPKSPSPLEDPSASALSCSTTSTIYFYDILIFPCLPLDPFVQVEPPPYKIRTHLICTVDIILYDPIIPAICISDNNCD